MSSRKIAVLVVALAGCLLLSCNHPQAQTVDPAHKQNHLAGSKSPYLLQHADNPVDWYPWGAQALDKAKREDKPIFLSIGYSTCHWCHVMERESYVDPAIAAVLNEHFVAVKVDREERPDLDNVYMAFVQSATGRGGWPLNVWLTPDLKPFYGGTYFAPASFKDVLQRMADRWAKDRSELVNSANDAARALAVDSATDSRRGPDRALLDTEYQVLNANFDRFHGGFGAAPKFARPVTLTFLTRYYALTGQKKALAMVTQTLRAIAQGGIHDVLGGGYHRYATDDAWRVPHFEKMLYDQALLACAFLEAYQTTGDSFYADQARDILDYVSKDLTDADGGFYAAEDADSARDPAHPDERAEGVFYVWTAADIDRILGPELAPRFRSAYGVKDHGNVERDTSGELEGQNVLHQVHELPDPQARRLLLAERLKRPRPTRDDKIVAGWNGLMISAYARAYQVLNDPHYLVAARRAADYLTHHLVVDGELHRYARQGVSDILGYNSDYAGAVQGLLDLYEASFDIEYLQTAVALQDKQISRFWDPSHGGFYETAGQDPTVLVHTHTSIDAAEPASGSVSALNLLRLSQMLDRVDYTSRAEATIRVFSDTLEQHPDSMPAMLQALAYDISPRRQIVIAGPFESPDTQRLLKLAYRPFHPHTVILLADGGSGQAWLAGQASYPERSSDGRWQANGVCVSELCVQQADVGSRGVGANAGSALNSRARYESGVRSQEPE